VSSASKIDKYINASPRRGWRVGLFTVCLFFQIPVLVIAWPLYILVKKFQIKWWVLLTMSLINFEMANYFSGSNFYFYHDFYTDINKLFHSNADFVTYLLQGNFHSLFQAIYTECFNYTVVLTPLVVCLFALIDLIKENPHTSALQALQRGQQDSDIPELSEERIKKHLEEVQENNQKGVMLGISKFSGQPVFISDELVNQIILVFGTTGGGKTVTLRRFNRYAIQQGYPLIIVDGKPNTKNIEYLQALASQFNRPFMGFNCGNFLPYDCLSSGGYTENKDKIICLKDNWDSEYYRTIAESYLQTVFAVLQAAKEKLDLKRVAECLDFHELALVARSLNDKGLQSRVASLDLYEKKDIQGLQAHLNLLIHSELGHFIENNSTSFNLTDAVKNNAVVYFALPALLFPSFSSVLGKLIINDIKTVIARADATKPIYCEFDEFSVFAGPQVLNLVNMGRERGLHTIFGTQGTADLEDVSPVFASQVLNCVNTIICHRLNDQRSAESICEWVGTKNSFTVTAQLDGGSGGLGSVRSNKEFIIHPDNIKQELQAGDAFVITKVGRFKMDKVKVKFSQ
jgi:hypothetical protein